MCDFWVKLYSKYFFFLSSIIVKFEFLVEAIFIKFLGSLITASWWLIHTFAFFFWKKFLVNIEFFNKLTFFLKVNGSINIASDSKSYVSEILKHIYEVTSDYKWMNQNKNEWDYLNVTLPQTKYFQKALKNGLNPIYLKLIKYWLEFLIYFNIGLKKCKN